MRKGGDELEEGGGQYALQSMMLRRRATAYESSRGVPSGDLSPSDGGQAISSLQPFGSFLVGLQGGWWLAGCTSGRWQFNLLIVPVCLQLSPRPRAKSHFEQQVTMQASCSRLVHGLVAR
jgi:hypothetical protein